MLLLINSPFAAKVNNMELSYKDGFTIARIDVNGTVRFSHQTEIAKDGKPYRIIVDVLSATHELGAKNFSSLPDCPIKALRTSQYSVNPEKVVRIVFDMDSERIYRIDSDTKSITITFSDKETKQFSSWSTSDNKHSKKTTVLANAPAKAIKVASATQKKSSKSTKQINNTINDDRMLSLKGANNTVTDAKKQEIPKKSTTAKQMAAKPKSKTSKKEVVYGPKVDYAALQKEITEQKRKETVQAKPELTVTPINKPEMKTPAPKIVASAEPKKETKVVAKPKAVKVSDNKQPAKKAALKQYVAKPKATESKSIEQDKLASTVKPVEKTDAKKTVQPVHKKTVVAKAQPVEKPVKKTVKKETPVNKTVVAKAASKPVKAVAKIDKKKEKITSTSRFRRSPATSRKIKGTMVAEFPKRLVIKYKSRKYRDPFETLINENKSYDNPIEKRIPNVEGLKIVGIIESDGEGNRALFEDNSGYGYILKSGDKVRKGYVLRVDKNKVYFQIFEYGWSRTVSLTLES